MSISPRGMQHLHDLQVKLGALEVRQEKTIRALYELHPVDVLDASQQALECPECFVSPPCPTRRILDEE